MKNKCPNNGNDVISQYNSDAKLLSDFEQCEQSGKSFDYSKQVKSAPQGSVPEQQITAYLSKIQRGGFIQPFGCLLAVEEPSFRIIAYSENSIDMLFGLDVDDDNCSLKSRKKYESLIGLDARTLFTHSSAASLSEASAALDISLFNPVWVQSQSTHAPFYGILHRIDVGMVIDLEPTRLADPTFYVAGAVQLQKLAVRAIVRLQSLPGCDIGALCDTIAEEVRELTGYDRVMVYKFHEDEHGEVISEIRRYDLEPFLGLHYPATDVPQAARFLFKQNRIRMICDCQATPARIIQSEELRQPLSLVNSTLRAPHGCHANYMANMGSFGSLVMAIIVNEKDSTKLWGLVSCHNLSPRYVPFPLRYACEFLMQTFSLQLSIELQLVAQLEEKKILKTQASLCDMLLRDIPLGIVTWIPNIMDLVKCDGAALYYDGRCHLLGVTPTEIQVKELADWVLGYDGDSTGLSTDSLSDAGYPDADFLCDVVCGLASVRITSKDFLFWFRSHKANDVKWGGAKHDPSDKDDGEKMHPRSSFKTFLEVVKNRSLPWEIFEMNAIHALQLILHGLFENIDKNGAKTATHDQQKDLEMDELGSVASGMVRLIETATTPILAVDSDGHINGWNNKISELTGLPAREAVGKSLIAEIVHEEFRIAVENHLARAMRGEEDKSIEIRLRTFGERQGKETVYIVANACASKDTRNNVVGVCFVGQDVTEEKILMDKFVRFQGDYKAITQSLNPLIPPIFASDENACCCEWNAAMEKLTGWTRGEVIGKRLPGEIFGNLCQLKDPDGITNFMILLYHTLCKKDTEKFPFEFFDREGKFAEALLTANKRTDTSGNVIGCFCFLQTILPDLQQGLEVQMQQERRCFSRLKELAYVREEVKNPLSGIQFTHRLLVATTISDDQKKFLETSDACERQMAAIIDDTDVESIEEGQVSFRFQFIELKMSDFLLGSVIDAVVSQVMMLLREKKLQLNHDIPQDIRNLSLYGDQVRLQQVLSEFLLHILRHAPSQDGWVTVKVEPGSKRMEDQTELLQLQLRFKIR
ncbi:hypothetical protein GIB67_004181 [Kingdonia uniflora]|uniref:Phytochrome n=1 Tax=Kingdonia uniflora TaxID=39325 RepID=A0A7J7LM72_9MAGN|nr:hypothetical protein GIB67_004181 [Kingdonia uniflora]